MSGKQVSLTLMLLAAVFIITAEIFNGVFAWKLSVLSLAMAGVMIAILGSPVSLNMLIEKFTGAGHTAVRAADGTTSGKNVSLTLMLVGALFTVVAEMLNGFLHWGVSPTVLAMVGVIIAALGSPVSLNLLAEKVMSAIQPKDVGPTQPTQ